MKYNLDVLSPLKFEKLSNNIISKKLNLEFKNFKMGKDGGIDLRNKENGIICQCKHIKKFSDLKSILKKELELSCPMPLNCTHFAPYLQAFSLFVYDMRTMKLNLGMIKHWPCGLEQQIKNMLSSGKKTINL